MIQDLKDFLSDQLSKDLPGELAHKEMAPIHRPLPSEARLWADTKYSGVLVLMYPSNERIHTALMMRPDYAGVHSNQVSFPGGRREESDADIQVTALREAEEELGIRKENVSVIGHLSELYIPPSKSLVTPVLAFSDHRPEFIPDQREVEAIIEADLFEMFQDKYFNNTDIVTSKYLMRKVPAILYQGYTIWGATAMILNEFKWVLRDFKT
jgi:8-oxo-dGTP pyrophosphatase MutT (NUDIX family)